MIMVSHEISLNNENSKFAKIGRRLVPDSQHIGHRLFGQTKIGIFAEIGRRPFPCASTCYLNLTAKNNQSSVIDFRRPMTPDKGNE